MMDSFALLAYASLAASRTLLLWLLACLNFTLDSESIYSVGTNEKWRLVREVWPETYDEGYIHQFQPEPTHKIH